MADIVDASTRSIMMSRIKAKNTKPEVLIRKKLFANGFRYRLHDKNLPGKPDMIFKKYNAVILFNGCFWHVHDCELFRWPLSRVKFWKNKLSSNKKRDKKNIEALKNLDWRILIIWECSYRSTKKKDWKQIDVIAGKAMKWLKSGRSHLEIRSAP